MGRFFLLLIALYVAYKLVFDLIIPVFRASRQVHRQFRTMNEHMQQQANTAQNGWQGEQPRQPNKTSRPAQPSKEDYIDFEEVK